MLLFFLLIGLFIQPLRKSLVRMDRHFHSYLDIIAPMLSYTEEAKWEREQSPVSVFNRRPHINTLLSEWFMRIPIFPNSKNKKPFCFLPGIYCTALYPDTDETNWGETCTSACCSSVDLADLNHWKRAHGTCIWCAVLGFVLNSKSEKGILKEERDGVLLEIRLSRRLIV